MNGQRRDIRNNQNHMKTPLSQLRYIMTSLICCEIQDNQINESIKTSLKDTTIFLELYKFSKKHDLSHLVASSLSKNDMLAQDEVSKKFQQQMMMAVYRYEQKKYALNHVKQILEEAEIPYIPLKGSVIQEYYPLPWLRTSCDIDILIHREDTDRAIAVLSEAGYVRQSDMTTHDYSFIAPGKVHLELHYSLDQGEQMKEVNSVLDMVWDYSTLDDSTQYEYKMSDDFFLLYHLAHMAKHFIGGGCGIRPFIDLWLLKNKGYCNSAQLSELLRRANLITFYESTMKLIGVWFEGETHNAVTEQMELFILTGGVYGTVSNSATVKAARGESKLRSFFNLMFLPRKSLEVIYPNLRKYPILYPFYQIKRWLRFFNYNKRKHVSNIVSARNSVTAEKRDDIKHLLDLLELQ